MSLFEWYIVFFYVFSLVFAIGSLVYIARGWMTDRRDDGHN